jgi:hypothetical protein
MGAGQSRSIQTLLRTSLRTGTSSLFLHSIGQNKAKKGYRAKNMNKAKMEDWVNFVNNL